MTDSGGPVTVTDKIILLNLLFWYVACFCDKGWEAARYHIW